MSPQRTVPRDSGRPNRRHRVRPDSEKWRRDPGPKVESTPLPSRFPDDELAATWRLHAACARLDEAGRADFFPGTGGLGRAETRRATAVCRVCPVMGRCLDYALSTPHEPHGTLGGASARQLRRWRRELRQ